MCIRALLHGQWSIEPSGPKRDLGTTENSYRAIASLMSISGRLLQIIMSRAKRDLSSFSSTTLTAVFILITLQLLLQVLSFLFFIVDHKLSFPVFSLSSTKVLNSFLPISLCCHKSFLISSDMTTLVTRLYRSLLEAESLLTEREFVKLLNCCY